MIKGISSIKGLGVYGNYSKPAGTKEFGVKNLIYGWNYSGKTTLSRLFSQLESKQSNPDLNGCSFTFETDSGVINEQNFAQTLMNFRVFNSDFIRDNLNFSGESFQPILLLGKDSDIAQAKIDELEDRKKLTIDRINAIDKAAQVKKKEFDGAKTLWATNIRTTLGITSVFNARNLDSAVAVLKSVPLPNLMPLSDYRNALKIALTPDNETFGSVSTISVSPSLTSLHLLADKQLQTIPSLNNTIELLADDPTLESWIENGLKIHEGKEVCDFCGGELKRDRIEYLLSHFSKDLSNYKEKIKQLLDKVKREKVVIKIPASSEFHHQYRNDFNDAENKLRLEIDKFNEEVSVLEGDVTSKINNLFKTVNASTLSPTVDDALTKAVDLVNEIIKSNNNLTSNFQAEKKRCVEKVKNHLFQEYINDEALNRREEKYKILEARSKKLNAFIDKLNREMQKQLAIISQAQLGREEINKRLILTLGSEAVQIKVVSINGQDRFQLVRKSGLVAKNLSDGERTAIAFNYFLIKLKELKDDVFSDTIVYIDDPISSLDSNHIFQVNAATREFFFHQDKNGTWTTKCKQIFISTHNFEFFNLLRELKPAGEKQQKLFLIKRINEQSTSFGNMPESLTRYSSEYHYLFEIIFNFHNAPEKTEHNVLILLPNAVRRFVELYTYSRLPGTSGETVDQRAEVLFGQEKAKRILKVLHFFSHANSIERLASNNELIFDVENAVKDLFSIISNDDPLHWNALLKAVS